MQISCPNCRKSFLVKDELIPSEGRKVQCGKCFHEWFFNPLSVSKKVEIQNDDKFSEEKLDFTPKHDESKKENTTKEFNFDDSKIEKIINKKEKNTNIFKLILVIIISFIALIIILETFKNQISVVFPDIIVILDNLFQTLNDIQLFIKDLVK